MLSHTTALTYVLELLVLIDHPTNIHLIRGCFCKCCLMSASYLSITLASVLKGISKWEWEKYRIHIIILDTEPDPHRSMLIFLCRVIECLVDIEAKELIGKYTNLFEVIPTNMPYNNATTWYEKEVLDYAQILRISCYHNPLLQLPHQLLLQSYDVAHKHEFVSMQSTKKTMRLK